MSNSTASMLTTDATITKDTTRITNTTSTDSIMQTWLNGIKNILKPTNIIHDLTDYKPGEWFLLALMLTIQVAGFIISGDYSMTGWIGLLTGVLLIISLILCDRGRLTNYLFGFTGSIGGLIIAMHNRLIGDSLSEFFYLIMSGFIGVYFWQKSIANNASNNDDNDSTISKTEIKPRLMTKLQALFTIACIIIGYFSVAAISHSVAGNLIWLDAAILPLSLAGQILMSLGYRAQWFSWIAVDAINVIIWSLRLNNGGAAASSMLVLQAIMLVNAIYGCWLWFHPNHSDK